MDDSADSGEAEVWGQDLGLPLDLTEIEDLDALTRAQIEAIIARPSPPGRRDGAWWRDNPGEKIKQSLIAKEQVAAGTFGGGAHTQPMKRRPAYEVAAAKAAINGNRLADELINQALHAPKASERKAAIDLLFEMELKVRSEQRDNEDHLMKLQGDELVSELFKVIRDLTGSDALDDYIEGSATEIGESSEAGEVSVGDPS